jgi:glucose/arabinose dehydrogenase
MFNRALLIALICFNINACGSSSKSNQDKSSNLPDTTPPVITEIGTIGRVSIATPELIFDSSEEGGISYGGPCSSDTSTVAKGPNTFTFNALDSGTYQDCTIQVEDSSGNKSAILTIKIFTITDTAPPIIREITPIGSSTTSSPRYTFHSSEVGFVTYGGRCESDIIFAWEGNNTISFNPLASGTYEDCTVQVKDNQNNVSNVLQISSFTISILDISPPVITEVSAIGSSNSNTPSYTFHSNESGTINYAGPCSSSTVFAVEGDNVINLNHLPSGAYDTCTIQVIDFADNLSLELFVSSFSINSIKLTEAFPLLPAIPLLVSLRQEPSRSTYWYALTQDGKLYRFDNTVNASEISLLLDWSDNTHFHYGETGALDFVFHPDFDSSINTNPQPYIYLYYTPELAEGISAIGRFQYDSVTSLVKASSNPSIDHILDNYTHDDPMEHLLEIRQPSENHNGGRMEFGPEGYLYLSLGDGGSNSSNGQNTETLLGSMIRINIDGNSYNIPSDNPFQILGCPLDKPDCKKEIYAFGFRNPWRWSFDFLTGEILLGDVGQNNTEEVNFVESGRNYGWDTMEGSTCYLSGDCERENLTLPIIEYQHSDTSSHCAITGGYTYRGTRLSQLSGQYIFGDYCSGTIWSATNNDGIFSKLELLDSDLYISSFAQTHEGEILILDAAGGLIYQLENEL